MIQPFEYYIRENLVGKTAPNTSLALALIKKAEKRFKRIQKAEIAEDESTLIFEDIYEAMREAGQSLMQLAQYKPYSHEAVIAFLDDKELLAKMNINILDNYRILRNKAVYQAEEISLEKCKEAFNFAKITIPKLKIKFLEMNKKTDLQKNKEA
ncbi:hypothetical protein HYU06_00575 [Candidatus Woesearchaeota archaeon]|nr:hypothetical protein [Candidatus Woesearchaeota archaeon]